MGSFFRFENNVDDVGSTVYINGTITDCIWCEDDVTPRSFSGELKQCKGDLTVVINSPGGYVLEGFSIYNQLIQYPGRVTVRIDSLAGSISSLIAMAGKEIIVTPVSNIMIHNPSSVAWGTSEDFRNEADTLDSLRENFINVYAERTKLSHEEIRKMMDKETWINAADAIKWGFADRMDYGNLAVDKKEKPSNYSYDYYFNQLRLYNIKYT